MSGCEASSNQCHSNPSVYEETQARQPAGHGWQRRPSSILRVRRRVSHDLRVHRKPLVIAPLDFLVLSEPFDQANAATAGQEKALREPEFGIHLGLFEDHFGAGSETG